LSAGVVIKVDNEGDRNGWIQVLETFGVTEVYELPGFGVPFPGSTPVENLGQVVNFHPAAFVVVQPLNADFVQGESHLRSFEHPPEALYVFGGTIARLTRGDLRGVTPAASVYIPDLGDTGADLFPSQAGGIVLWDRYHKLGGVS
jgi:hypothetical protein